MSLYNMVMQTSLTASLSLGMLKVDPKNVPRLRDAWLSDGGDTITILTRTGGGNRADYEAENHALTEFEGYKENHDDAFDSTFAHFVYETPERFKEDAEIVGKFVNLIGQGAESRGPGAMIERAKDEPGDTPDHGITPESPEYVAVNEAFVRIADQLEKE